ncbi:adenosylcobinamide-phosphate synthase CbiB [Halomonas caseinilytica]|uniref:adenosylcobinamide-phosphate synthase CbiB n=1 Tax=Halomonas caseinilytica TaxID=438744 RepID=UPI0007E54BA3|nr:adenosylcobinamide-phosphate synthase CbiB [Halomonas caseinilytica]SEN18096.1 adenosylcobinamide-phosphate synthase [Halomonas caseinilytica]
MSVAPLSFELLALVGVALVIDLALGDPPWLPHPVVGIGRVIAWLERAWNHGSAVARQRRGVWLACVVVVGTWTLAWSALTVLAWVSPGLALVAELVLLAMAFATRGLADAARAVAEPLRCGDLPAARLALGRIVGRDTEALDEAGLTRGAVETVAENTVDGITAPLCWALLGGAPLALAYKAVNTLDSMVGYRSPRYADFGRASARLDDAVNWLPARLTALAMWLAARFIAESRTAGALAATCREAPRHPSPNAGWPEAMVAHLLGVRLGGLNHYDGHPSHRATLGQPREPLVVGHIERAIRYMHGGWLGVLLLLVPLVLLREWLS